MLWLGAEFARNSFHILRWLAVGVYINSFAQVPFGLIQGAGRPDITAKFHIVQVPLYVAAVWLLIKAFGLEGVAIAWVLRIALDAGLLFYMSWRFSDGHFNLAKYMAIFSCSLLAIFSTYFAMGIAVKITITLSILICSLMIMWSILLTKDEKIHIFDNLRLGFLNNLKG